MNKVIVVDDEMMIRKSLQEQLRKHRLSVATAETLQQAKGLLAKDQFDLIFIDMNLPDGQGVDLLEFMSQDPNAPMAVMMTGSGSIESAVECMKQGAIDYITKPFSFQQVDLLLKRTRSHKQLFRSTASNELSAANIPCSSNLIGESVCMQSLKKMAKKVAMTEATVLITGENGTGKEEIAGEIHRLSPLSDKAFIKVNCAAIAENLLESEFFGHEKGAFTGASYQHKGRFELANNGTILLDEIGEISPRLQAMLLRVLQSGEFERVGGTQTLKVCVRVLATTNRDLEKAVKEGHFREDLFYRLNVFPIKVPALRNRGEDVLLIAKDFLKRFSRKHSKNLNRFTPEAEDCLLKYPFPGNVRELQNTIERAVILSEKGRSVGLSALDFIHERMDQEEPQTQAISTTKTDTQSTTTTTSATLATQRDGDAEHRQGDSKDAATEPNPPSAPYAQSIKSLDQAEKDYILSVLAQSQGSLEKTAQLLSISQAVLQDKLKEYVGEAPNRLTEKTSVELSKK